MRDPISDLKRYARDLEAEVPVELARYRVARVIHHPVPGPRWSRRTVMAGATTVLMGLSNVALAAIANPAAPGDALYGIDRAYERVIDLFGLPGDHHAERLDEATVLLDRGRAVEALELVREALQEIADTDDVADARRQLEALDAASRIDQESLRAAVEALVEAAKRVAQHVDEAGLESAASLSTVPGMSISDAARALRAAIHPVDVPRRPDHAPGPPDGKGPRNDNGPPGLDQNPPGGPSAQTSTSPSGDSPASKPSAGSAGDGNAQGADQGGTDQGGTDQGEDEDPGPTEDPGEDEDTP